MMPKDETSEANEEIKRIYKEALKEGLKEWMDDHFSTLGKWTLRGLAVLAFGGIVALMLWSQGWHK